MKHKKLFLTVFNPCRNDFYYSFLVETKERKQKIEIEVRISTRVVPLMLLT